VTRPGISMVTHPGTSKLLHFKLTDGCWHPRLIHDEYRGAIILMSCLYNMFYHRPSPTHDLISKWLLTSAPAADNFQIESSSFADSIQPTSAPAADSVQPSSKSLLHLLHKDRTKKTESSTDISKLHSVIGLNKCFNAVPPKHCYKDYVQTNTYTTFSPMLENPRLHHKVSPRESVMILDFRQDLVSRGFKPVRQQLYTKKKQKMKQKHNRSRRTTDEAEAPEIITSSAPLEVAKAEGEEVG
jgi:hypothetical protein